MNVQFTINQTTESDISNHLLDCDASFVKALIIRVDIAAYSTKIFHKAMRFEAWSNQLLVGLVASYFNNEHHTAYITSVSVLDAWKGNGIAGRLLCNCIELAGNSGVRSIRLEVACDNEPAIELYKTRGFLVDHTSDRSMIMTLFLDRGKYVHA